MENKLMRKVLRKTKRCENILLNHEKVNTSKIPTKSLCVGNGGLGCGLTRESLMDIFSVYGIVKSIVMPPCKPYAFIVYNELDHSVKAYSHIHGQNLSSTHTLYLFFVCDEEVPKEIVQNTSWPKGLVIIDNFISEEQEKEMLAAIHLENEDVEKSQLRHRKVQHYGYEFIYGSNNIDKNNPLDRKIPVVCIQYLKKLVSLGYLSRMPEQLTVNHYMPGQGIPPHIDTHSAFEDGIVSLSLSSQVIMDFYNAQETLSVLLARRSALIMLGESRYLWKHGITPRKTDIVSTNNGLTLVHRSARTSFTFRLIREGPCHCDFKEQCDSQT